MPPIDSQAPETATHAAADAVAEHATLLQGCGLVDRSQRGKLALTGSGAAEFLSGQVTNDIERLAGGEGCYAAFLTHKGKMLGDLRVLAVSAEGADGPAAMEAAAAAHATPPAAAPTELLLDTERSALQALFDMIRRFKIGYDVELHKRTLECGLLSLIGPQAREVTTAAIAVPAGASASDAPTGAGSPSADGASVAAAPLPREVEHAHRTAAIAGRPVRLIATAQPDGIDVLCDAGDTDAVRLALLAAGAAPVGEQAAEVVRVEHGRPRYGIDLDETVIPQEAGLNVRAVSFTKGCYVGQETVARLHYKGRPNRYLRGLRLSQPAPEGAELHLGEKPVGRLTSPVLSPTLGPIGLALVRREAQISDSLLVGDGEIVAEVVDLPFSPL